MRTTPDSSAVAISLLFDEIAVASIGTELSLYEAVTAPAVVSTMRRKPLDNPRAANRPIGLYVGGAETNPEELADGTGGKGTSLVVPSAILHIRAANGDPVARTSF
jgi:hypothetical protein